MPLTRVRPSAQYQKIRLAVATFLATTPAITLALAFSLVFHAVVLSIHFRLPEAMLRNTENALDVVLVNSKHAKKPKNAQVYAQANLDGGGESEQNQRATTFIPPTTSSRDGNDIIDAQRRVAQLEAEQRQLMTRLKAQAMARAAPKRTVEAPTQPVPPNVSGLDIASRALATARLEAQIDRQINEYNKRPRVKNIGTRAEEYRFAQYVEDWRQKIERIGNLNYPEAAKGRFYGSLLLTVTILSDGNIKDVEINRSSGAPVLDQAAVRIVRMSAPYAAFPDNIRRDTDIVQITRKWTFTRADMLQTQ
jgi:periplasmic protein TonB